MQLKFFVIFKYNLNRIMLSLTFTLTNRSSILSYKFNPPIYLDEDPSVEYEIGLTNSETFNLIPNMNKRNNIFSWGEENEFKIEIPAGSLLKNLIELINTAIIILDDEAGNCNKLH